VRVGIRGFIRPHGVEIDQQSLRFPFFSAADATRFEVWEAAGAPFALKATSLCRRCKEREGEENANWDAVMDEKLNEQDVRRLLDSPDRDVRAEIAGKIAAQHPRLTEHERELAEDILRLMVKDAEVRVREALSRQLKENPLLPHDLALTLAQDVDEVALPILQYSAALSDDDLIALVRSQGPSKQDAIARRATISASVAEVIVEVGPEAVVKTLMTNKGAELNEETLIQVAERYPATGTGIGEALAMRPNLPVSVVEKLLTQVSENFRSHLLDRTDLSPEVATALLLQARELAVLGLSTSNSDASDLVEHLARHKRLTPSIILRALCMGDLSFFEASLAKLADISLENAQKLIYDKGQRGFEALYKKAGLSPGLYPAMRAAIDIFGTMDYDGGLNDRERFSRRMIERILTQYGEEGVEFKNDDLEYLLARISQLPSGAPN